MTGWQHESMDRFDALDLDDAARAFAKLPDDPELCWAIRAAICDAYAMGTRHGVAYALPLPGTTPTYRNPYRALTWPGGPAVND